MNIGERIKEARERKGLTKADVARHFKIKPPSVSEWESGATRPDMKRLPDLAKLLDVTVDWLTGEGVLPVSSSSSVNQTLSEIRRIEVIGILQAGLFREAVELPPDDREILALPADIPYSKHQLGAFRVVGPSMDRFYPDGSYVIAVPSIELGSGWIPADGQHVIVQRRNSWGEYETTIKEVRYENDRVMLWPQSSHPEFQKPWELAAEQPSQDAGADGIRVTGLVVWFVGRAPRT